MEKIPQFLQNTQIAKIIQNELNFKKQLLEELKELLSNFATINVEESINSKYIALIMLSLFNSFHPKKGLKQDIINSLKASIFAIKSIGTDESFHLLFKAFFHARIKIKVNPRTPGEIIIQLLDNIRAPIKFKIAGKINGKLKVIKVKHQGKLKKLVSNYIPKNFKNSIYGFIKSLMPAGRTIKIFDIHTQKSKTI
ncbi:DUF735 family protein (plasmid) [Borrelia miyamotoi]|uniref:DUF735 family protein n=1 Tax=Borrelia miyamotoi TaxID=47466 RepID=A0AAX3JNH8_9SPIR|nr:DUF735 family protein [Borrelia miyamotoi]QFP42329.1 DUF735 family protein [Borrelia miyamotoi]QFP48449.1 DUF735 family protein [Borrelia miyamotoi]WAZ72347.1 DUF735 family protein [Borrelia miyamotoi]